MAKTHTLLAALALTGAALGAPAADAADISSAPRTIELTAGAGFFGDAFGMNNRGNSFTDVFRFSATGGSNLDAIVSSISHGASTGLDITAFDVYSALGGGGAPAAAADKLLTHGTRLQSGATDVWTVSSDNLTAGDYWLQVTGTMNSAGSAAFGGALAMAVPEPLNYAMLLGGLGVIGLAARRRQR
jgi:hypothetical protein